MRTASWLTWPGWEQLLVRWCLVFHVGAAAVLAFTPRDLVYTEGTAPVLDLASQYVWAVVFAVAAALSWWLLRSDRAWVQMATWFAVFVPGGLWFTAFLLAAVRGEVSGLGCLVWFCLYGPWVVAAVRVGLRKR